LLACAFIVMWIQWLEKKLKFKWFTDENLFEYSYEETLKKWYKFMPRNLWEAYLEYNSSNILKERLWNSIFEAYWNLIMEEIDECQSYADLYSLKKHYLR
jgi:glutamine synthetase